MGQETNLENLSIEEIKELKDSRVNFMKNSLEDLRVQDEYTRLKANISENTLRDTMSKMKLATLKMPKPPEDGSDPETKDSEE